MPGSGVRRFIPLRGRLVAGVAVALATVVAGCGGGNSDSGGAASSGGSGPIKIGASISMTGDLAQFGQQLKDGYTAWEDAVNAKGGLMVNGKRQKVDVVFRDDQSDATTSTNLVQQFISQDGIKFILGPYSSAIGQQVSTITEKNGAVMMLAGGTADSIFERGYKNIFAVWPKATLVTGNLVRVMHEVDPAAKSVGFAVQDDLFSKSAEIGAKAEAQKLGLKVVMDETYPADITDLSSVVGKAKAANPDMLIEFGHLEQAISLIKQSKQLNYRPRDWATIPGPETPEFGKSLGSLADGVIWYGLWGSELKYSDPLFGSVKGYVDAFQKQFGHAPSYNSASATANAEVLGLGIEKANSTDPSAVSNALHSYEGTTLHGKVKFDPSGWNQYGAENMAFYQVRDNAQKNILIRPANAAEGKPVAPLPEG